MNTNPVISCTVAFALSVCSSSCESKRPKPISERPHILLITLDTARADRFSYVSKESGVSTPNIDRLLAEGVAFTNAMTPVPLTLPAHASLLTGKNPNDHGVRNNGFYRLPDGETTLAEALREVGYATGAFVAAAVLDSKYGLDQGFDQYDDALPRESMFSQWSYAERTGDEVVSAAMRWLHSQTGPTFTWVHLFEPHQPYLPHQPGESGRTRLYNGEITYSDGVIGRLFQHFREEGRWDNTVVVFTSDHGESLGEHGEDTHALFVYQSTLHIPLVIRVPGMKPRIDNTPVHLTDVFNTVAILSDLKRSFRGQGANLFDEDLPRTVQGRTLFFESLMPEMQLGWAGFRGARIGNFKLIRGSRSELFNLEEDPDELATVGAGQEKIWSKLHAEIETEFAGDQHGPRMAIDRKTRAQLESLGYLGADPIAVDQDVVLADPRDRIEVFAAVQEVKEMASGGRVTEALSRLDSLDQSVRDDRIVRDLYVDILMQEGRYTDVLERMEHYPEAEKMGFDYLSRKSDALAGIGRFDLALECIGEQIRVFPDDPDTWGNRGAALQMLGRKEEALQAYDKAVSLDDHHTNNRINRWNLMLRLGKTAQVRREVVNALDTNPRDEAALRVAPSLGVQTGQAQR